ncbi:hypothetical protein LAJ19_07650 [Deinococcus taeanensis]|uniref:hypothetical protein n=1 Tax=Deinococcus taeanensis TaxID=2737050 RepID=UPI001CDC4B15|nr:hypothetical protein [Deinococcus taeanensis]UBV41541.1 hypothetical protein LAJ19_07650 [Deinococcus taeanensis]
MKQMLLVATGALGLLTSCGSFGAAPDGSANARVSGVSTEYTLSGTSPAQYVGCDVITNPTDTTRATSTQVVVTFAAAGSISKVDVTLRGTTSSQYDETQTIQGSGLVRDANGDYKAVFDFRSATGDYLPASIVVSPTPPAIRTVKPVTVNTTDRVGSFYADLKVYTTTGAAFTITSKNLGSTGNIAVYRNCTLANTAQPLNR